MTRAVLSLTLWAMASGVPAATAQPAAGLEIGASYSFLRSPEYSGWTISLAPDDHTRVVAMMDLAGYYADDQAVYLFTFGPRLARRLGSATLSAHALVGAAMNGNRITLVAFPGVAADFGNQGWAGLRLQADWPMLTGTGPATGVPRFSAGLLLRPSWK